MREISLHILDLIENSIRAAATIVGVSVVALPAEDKLRIIIEDNGGGLKVAPENALDPFYTTKRGKRTGLGLSLFRAAAEATGGRLTIGTSTLGGVQVTVEMGLSHVDRNPLGDLGGTFASAVCTNPGVEFRLSIGLDERVRELNTRCLAAELGIDRNNTLVLANHVMQRINAELQAAKVLS